MMEPQYMRVPLVARFFQLIGLWLGCMILGALIAMVIIAAIWGGTAVMDIASAANPSGPGAVWGFRIFVALSSSLVGFLGPAIIFSYWVTNEPEDYITLHNPTPVILLLLAAVFMVAFLPTVDITAYFNQKMTLPPALHGLDKWIHDMEASGAAQFKVLLDMKTPADLVISLFIVAVFPGVCEEFFFRGCMQPIFQKATKNVHAAVWITAFIFSFMHLEFLGFVPRMLLGAALGYLYAWSGSIWPSVVAHFCNNAFSVVALYLYQHKTITGDPDNGQPMFSQAWIYVVAFAVSMSVLYLFRKIALNKKLLIADGEELD